MSDIPSNNVLAAAQDTTNPEHHCSLGQVLATVMLGATDAMAAYTTRDQLPAAISSFVTGFLQIWLPAPTKKVQ